MVSSENSSANAKPRKLKRSNLAEKNHVQHMINGGQRGRIEIIMGPMFAGKSTELLRRVNRLEISGKKCLSVKFGGD